MATERLKSEVATGDVPKIDLGNFSWSSVDQHFGRAARAAAVQPQLFQQVPANTGSTVDPSLPAKRFMTTPDPKPAPPLTSEHFPLDRLQSRTFAGTGYNTVWRPRSTSQVKLPDDIPVKGTDDVLELNLTAETMSFSNSLGQVPNRGNGSQADLPLQGLSYVQRVGAFERVKTAADTPVGIHFEPGVLMFVPASDTPAQGKTINRMASVPHGTTINAQGPAPLATQTQSGVAALKSSIPITDIIPFKINNTGAPVPKTQMAQDKQAKLNIFSHQLKFTSSSQEDRLPDPLSDFPAITSAILTDPNTVLRNALDGQEIDSFVTFTLTTNTATNPVPNTPIFGGGTANIGFLAGGPANNPAGNAIAAEMTVQYWVETVGKTLTVQPKQANPQTFEMVSAAGVLGPKFVFPPTTNLIAPVTKRVTWTQLQYSQLVLLNFNGLSWPHVSVATLGDTSTVNMSL